MLNITRRIFGVRPIICDTAGLLSEIPGNEFQ